MGAQGTMILLLQRIVGSLARAAAMYAAPRHVGLNKIKRRASGVGSAELPCALQTVSETIICYNTTSVNCWETNILHITFVLIIFFLFCS